MQPEEKALLFFVLKVIRDPALTAREDVAVLKELGWSDQDLFDATMVAMDIVAMGVMFKASKVAAPIEPIGTSGAGEDTILRGTRRAVSGVGEHPLGLKTKRALATICRKGLLLW